MPAVSFTRLDYREVLKQWNIIRDCYAGEHTVKHRRDLYLPRPNPADSSAENQSRYQAYLTRAVFYNVTKRTLNGLVGLCFTRDPVITIPPDLEPILENADGSGANVIQLAKIACRLTVGYGRCGIFIDYPTGDLPASRADIQAGKARPTIKVYEPWRVINWRTVFRDGLEILSLVVLEEPYVKSDDGFVVTFGRQWRVLRLDGVQQYVNTQVQASPGTDPNQVAAGIGVYMVDVYRDTDLTRVFETFTPTDGDGKPIDTIPFMFIGAENNRAGIDDPPLYDLASLNIAHYRNSADYEESAYILGQPTPYFTGLTQAWVDGPLKGQVQLGARAAVPLPVGATAGMLQPTPNSMAFEAMEHKEKQMIAIGANLIDTTKAPRTATETLIDDNNERSVLATAGDNVSDAFVFALTWCARYQGVEISESPGIEFCINTDFDLVRLTAQERQELVLEWQAEAISWTEMRQNFKRGGIATQDDTAARADIKANPPPAPVTMTKPLPGASSQDNPPQNSPTS